MILFADFSVALKITVTNLEGFLGMYKGAARRRSGEHWTMENARKYFKEKRDDLYSRYRLAKTPEDKKRVLRDMQRFNLDTRKYRGVIPPITATSLRQAALQKPEKAFLSYGRAMEASP